MTTNDITPLPEGDTNRDNETDESTITEHGTFEEPPIALRDEGNIFSKVFHSPYTTFVLGGVIIVLITVLTFCNGGTAKQSSTPEQEKRIDIIAPSDDNQTKEPQDTAENANKS